MFACPGVGVYRKFPFLSFVYGTKKILLLSFSQLCLRDLSFKVTGDRIDRRGLGFQDLHFSLIFIVHPCPQTPVSSFPIVSFFLPSLNTTPLTKKEFVEPRVHFGDISFPGPHLLRFGSGGFFLFHACECHAVHPNDILNGPDNLLDVPPFVETPNQVSDPDRPQIPGSAHAQGRLLDRSTSSGSLPPWPQLWPSGFPRGFGFVELENAEAQQAAIAALNGMTVQERVLICPVAREVAPPVAAPPPPPRPPLRPPLLQPLFAHPPAPPR
ncbi:hypothetical protein PAPYR_2845 [Paratrimastix pyriformis]|uniref:RRM domain-containing protein n=1 Tax=Paratrimastix pyriformis TaxID=342808 RepID=A0ABQ8U878_9EUKA|nr:hypothetical protein PAPYR_12631 [Paratrimastix pyriformis]KAJ4460986.1 hypothetical protein PAPYR_2845 [Paratrimastix pyriformis]